MIRSKVSLRPSARAWFFLLLAGCVKSNDITVRTSEIDSRSQPDTGDDYDFEHVSVDGYALQKPGFFAVHGASDWSQAWARDDKGNVPPVPGSVDFKTHMLFVATSKTPGASSIEVQKIIRTFDGLHVYVLETLPAPGCPAEPRPGQSPAMDIVSLDNVPYDMHIVYDRVHAESCGPPPDAVVACRIAGSGAKGDSNVTASPGAKIDCDSTQSRPRIGTITERSWHLGTPPPGSASTLAVGKNNMGATFSVDAWGVYQVELSVHDSAREGSAVGLIEVLPSEAGVQLYFEHAERMDPAQLPHVELHVLEMPYGLGSGRDCTSKSQRSFCEVRTTGSMQQAALHPEEGKRYHVMVKYLDSRFPGAPTACVRAFAHGARPVSSCDAADAQRGKGAIWDVGALDVPHAKFYDARLPKPPEPVAPAANGDSGDDDSDDASPKAAPKHAPPPPATHAAPKPPKPPPPPSGGTDLEL